MKKSSAKKSTKKAAPLLEQSYGKNYELEDVRNLEKLLDMGSNNPYGTIDKQIFREKVEAMTLDQMGSLAVRVGVQLSNRQSHLKTRLIDAFDDFQRRHRSVLGGIKVNPSIKDSPAIKNIQDLLEFPDRRSK